MARSINLLDKTTEKTTKALLHGLINVCTTTERLGKGSIRPCAIGSHHSPLCNAEKCMRPETRETIQC